MAPAAAEEKEKEEVVLSDETAKEYARYDLLSRLSPFLDRHLILLIVEEYLSSGVYSKKDITKAILDISYECLLPYEPVMEKVEALYKSIGEEVDAKWERRKDDLLVDMETSKEIVMPLLQIFEDEAKLATLKEFKTRVDIWASEDFELSLETLEELVPYARKMYTARQYQTSLSLLDYYTKLPQAESIHYVIKYVGNGEVVGYAHNLPEEAEEEFERLARGLDFGKSKDKDADKDTQAVIQTEGVVLKGEGLQEFVEVSFHGKSRDKIPLMKAWFDKQQSERKAAESAKERQIQWGTLASAILIAVEGGEGSDDASAQVSNLLIKMDELLTKWEAPRREILQQKSWLLHWTLFAIFKIKSTDSKIVDFFLKETSLSVISLCCPHLFRYVGACLILQKRLKAIMKETVWIIHHEASSYSDPITQFLLALNQEMDYDEAQLELQRCEQVCRADFFLKSQWAEFQENARLLVFESYCRIHQMINIQMIAEKLNMQAEEAELWIVKLIQNAKLDADARIDSEKSRVVMTKAQSNVYQQVIEKTKNLAFRSTMLVSNMEKS